MRSSTGQRMRTARLPVEQHHTIADVEGLAVAALRPARREAGMGQQETALRKAELEMHRRPHGEVSRALRRHRLEHHPVVVSSRHEAALVDGIDGDGAVIEKRDRAGRARLHFMELREGRPTSAHGEHQRQTREEGHRAWTGEALR